MRYGPETPDETYVSHAFDEASFDTGEVTINYAVAGDPDRPALLLVPAQTESWWGFEQAMTLLADDFQVFAVDLRGQGRSTRTPGRYTIDNFGNDLVRFIAGRIARPTIVSGTSSGGVVSAWLSAYAPPGMIRAACYEDPPLFASEIDPAYGPSLRQGLGPMLALLNKYLGDQWSIADWPGLCAAARNELPPFMSGILGIDGDTPPQRLKEYDPEWGRAFATGTVSASCDHERMLSAVKVPVLFTHHFRRIDESTGALQGAISDLQARRVGELVSAAGQRFDYRSFPQAGHLMHALDPALFVTTLREWMATLP
ncbi:alpha/beta hydrolase [Dactylosporangium sp. NPDC051485]|uniref:alpha/beta fold hydrolase n=1 Tax=Dactylosporangium sp. NPDC051485 TaxID=3154846 RepID=UPI003439C137